jgi:hypothetical protein
MASQTAMPARMTLRQNRPMSWTPFAKNGLARFKLETNMNRYSYFFQILLTL